MPTTTRIGAATDALLVILRARGDLSTVDITDGPPLDWGKIKLRLPEKGDGSRYLFVGATPDGDLAAESAIDYNAAGAVSTDERFDLMCSAVGWDGAGSVKTSRDRAIGLISSTQLGVQSDPTLGGTVLYSRVSTVDRFDVQQNDRGCSVAAVFRVACRAYLSA